MDLHRLHIVIADPGRQVGPEEINTLWGNLSIHVSTYTFYGYNRWKPREAGTAGEFFPLVAGLGAAIF